MASSWHAFTGKLIRPPQRAPSTHVVVSRDEYFHQEMQRLERAWIADVEIVVIDACTLCREHDKPPPPWLWEAIHQSLNRAIGPRRLRGGKPGNRTGNPVAAAREAYKHFLRWEWSQFYFELYAGLPRNQKPTRPAVFRIVSDELIKTPAWGRPKLIEKSFNRVQAAIKKGLVRDIHVPSDANEILMTAKAPP